MEKILDFKKGHPMDFPSKVYRFQCDCLDAADAMDITVEACGVEENSKFITILMNFYGSSLLDRLKYAFWILRGRWSWREFVVRDEDFKNLTNIFNPDIKYCDLE